MMQQYFQPCRVYASVKELCNAVDVVSVSMPNYARVEVFEQILEAVKAGAKLMGVVCEKPLARNMAEANRVVAIIDELATHGVRFAYFENQIHMPAVKTCRFQLAQVAETCGPIHMVRPAEEHSGPHAGWFWDPMRQGGGVWLDMGCHSAGVGWYMLTPDNEPIDFLVPVSVNANLELVKWGCEPWLSRLRDKHKVDYTKTPAEDYALVVIKFRNPKTGQIIIVQATDSWMYDAPGLRLLMEAYGPGYSYVINTLDTPATLFISDAAATACASAEGALEKSLASRGHLKVLPDEAAIYGYVNEWIDALHAFRRGKDGLLDARFARDVVRLLMAGYLSAERGEVVSLESELMLEELETYIPLIQQGKGSKVLLTV